MSVGVLALAVQKLSDLLIKEYKKFVGVKKQVVELQRVLNFLSSFMQDAYAKKHTQKVVRTCVEEINEIILDAEDVIENFLLKGELRKTSTIKRHIRRLACNIPDQRKIATDIEGLSNRIAKVIENMRSFGVQQIVHDDASMHPIRERQREMRQTFPMDNENDFEGLEANVEKLVEYLLEENNIQVVSITGMGGVGKTTLARQVYNHEMVKMKFDEFAWVCISQNFKRKEVWQMILLNLRPKEDKDEILHMAESTLHEKLFQLLKSSKTLIVLDDIWTNEAWDLVQCVIPAEKGYIF